MPTGYTAAIEEGCTFEEYAWGCAKGMGACIMMRDDPWDKPIPDAFEPRSYYRERLDRANEELAEIEALSDQAITDRMIANNAGIRARNEKYRLKHADLKQKYETMREKVSAWGPPSTDHVGLKQFMFQQIDLCLDQGEPYQARENEIVTPDEWRKAAIADARKEIARAADEWNKEQERTTARNLWLKQLRESIPQPLKAAA